MYSLAGAGGGRQALPLPGRDNEAAPRPLAVLARAHRFPSDETAHEGRESLACLRLDPHGVTDRAAVTLEDDSAPASPLDFDRGAQPRQKRDRLTDVEALATGQEILRDPASGRPTKALALPPLEALAEHAEQAEQERSVRSGQPGLGLGRQLEDHGGLADRALAPRPDRANPSFADQAAEVGPDAARRDAELAGQLIGRGGGAAEPGDDRAPGRFEEPGSPLRSGHRVSGL